MNDEPVTPLLQPEASLASRLPWKRCGYSWRGFWIGFRWVTDGFGYSSYSTASLASFHHPRSITWRWALYWSRPPSRFTVSIQKRGIGISAPWAGGLWLSWQDHMWFEKQATHAETASQSPTSASVDAGKEKV